jgi:hypothetical protein
MGTPYVPKFRPALAAALWAISTCAATAGGLDHSISQVHGDLQALLHCEWQGSTPYTICPARQMRDVVGLYADASGDFPETVEFHPLLTINPPDSDANKLSHDTIVAILHYFFPDWKEEASWVSDALKAADEAETAEHVITLDGATLYIRSLDIEDGEGNYAMVVVTRKSSIDQWTVDKTSIVK